MQREINSAYPASGVVQVIKNTGDATIWGAEVDALFYLTDSLRLTAAVGYTNAGYDEVRFDLNGDGMVDEQDEDLDLPRAPEWTYSVGFDHTTSLGYAGELVSRISYSYRDESAYTDSNLGYINEQRVLDAGMDYYADSGMWNVGIYAKNLLDEVLHGGDTQLPAMLGPAPLGGTFSPLGKGRVYGVELTVNFE